MTLKYFVFHVLKWSCHNKSSLIRFMASHFISNYDISIMLIGSILGVSHPVLRALQHQNFNQSSSSQGHTRQRQKLSMRPHFVPPFIFLILSFSGVFSERFVSTRLLACPVICFSVESSPICPTGIHAQYVSNPSPPPLFYLKETVGRHCYCG